MSHVQIFDLEFDTDIPEIQPNLPETEPTTSASLTLPTIDLVMDIGNQPPPVKKSCFKSVGSELVDQLAAAVTSTSTDNQTKWAVKIFTGGLFCRSDASLSFTCTVDLPD